MLVEAVCCSVEDCLAAQRAGAQRIELCVALEVGGLTPSAGLMQLAVQRCDLPIMAMIRPRPGGFNYSGAELQTMALNAQALLSLGAVGVVCGALTESNEVDTEACRELLSLVGGAQAVFHRAFDLTPDPVEAMEQIIRAGFNRLLSSGQAETAWAGRATLRVLIAHAEDRLEILPAGGIRVSNAAQLVAETGCGQLHLAPRLPVGEQTGFGQETVLDERELALVVRAVSAGR